jgi:hypothetical protein
MTLRYIEVSFRNPEVRQQLLMKKKLIIHQLPENLLRLALIRLRSQVIIMAHLRRLSVVLLVTIIRHLLSLLKDAVNLLLGTVLGGLPMQSTLKPLVDFLITVKGQFTRIRLAKRI